MASVCFPSCPVCACEPSMKARVLLKGITPGKWGGRKPGFGVLYIDRNDFPQIKTCSFSATLAGTSCSFPVLKNLRRVRTMPAKEQEMSCLENLMSFFFFWIWPQVQTESYVYRICDIWMNRLDCAILIHINSETIDMSFWTIIQNKRLRWKRFLWGCKSFLSWLYRAINSSCTINPTMWLQSSQMNESWFN